LEFKEKLLKKELDFLKNIRKPRVKVSKNETNSFDEKS